MTTRTVTIYLTTTEVAIGANIPKANKWAAKNLVAASDETLQVCEDDNELVNLNIKNLGVQTASIKLSTDSEPITIEHTKEIRKTSLDLSNDITLLLYDSPTPQNLLGPLAPYATLTLTKVPPRFLV